MTSARRLRRVLLVSAGLGAAAAPALFPLGCGPEAVGVEACRKIESARCEAAAACGESEDEVEDCKLLYADQCLHGVENTDHRPTETETEACVAAVTAVGQCAANGVETMSACSGVALVEGAPDRAPCDVVLTHAHELAACAFAAGIPDAGTTDDAATDAGADAASD